MPPRVRSLSASAGRSRYCTFLLFFYVVVVFAVVVVTVVVVSVLYRCWHVLSSSYGCCCCLCCCHSHHPEYFQVCHTSFITQFMPRQEEQCLQQYRKQCDIIIGNDCDEEHEQYHHDKTMVTLTLITLLNLWTRCGWVWEHFKGLLEAASKALWVRIFIWKYTKYILAGESESSKA